MARPSCPSLLLRRFDPIRDAPDPFRQRGRALRQSHTSGLGPGILSWGCQRLPLHRHLRMVFTPGDPAAPESCRLVCPRGDAPPDAVPPSARSCQPPGSFRPCRSSRLRRFPPPHALQVCCTLKPIMGFATFRVCQSVLYSRLSLAPAEAVANLCLQASFPCGMPVRSQLLPGPRSSGDPQGRRLTPRGRRPVSLDRPLWRSTLRSFPLTSSCAASTAPSWPHAFRLAFTGKPDPVRRWARDWPLGCGPPQPVPSRRCSKTVTVVPSHPD
jgi:hypothetical protein